MRRERAEKEARMLELMRRDVGQYETRSTRQPRKGLPGAAAAGADRRPSRKSHRTIASQLRRARVRQPAPASLGGERVVVQEGVGVFQLDRQLDPTPG